MAVREEILDLLSGNKINRVPAFSGLSHVTAAGLEHEGLAFHEIHRDADKMARAAASTFRLTGFSSAAAPFDLCVEAEALGAEVDFRENAIYEFPRVAKPPFQTSEVVKDFRSLGRIPLICEAIAKLKTDIGENAVIGGILAGPYTLLSMLVERGALFKEMRNQPETVIQSLLHLSSFISQTGHAYRTAGADFLTIHEMGGSPKVLGAARFEQFVFPALKKLLDDLPHPRVLAVCGNVGVITSLLAAAGADAISIDQSNDLAAVRSALPDSLLFGNLDPVELLSRGAPDQVRAEAEQARRAGVDALWPGCDLVPSTPLENTRAMITDVTYRPEGLGKKRD